MVPGTSVAAFGCQKEVFPTCGKSHLHLPKERPFPGFLIKTCFFPWETWEEPNTPFLCCLNKGTTGAHSTDTDRGGVGGKWEILSSNPEVPRPFHVLRWKGYGVGAESGGGALPIDDGNSPLHPGHLPRTMRTDPSMCAWM